MSPYARIFSYDRRFPIQTRAAARQMNHRCTAPPFAAFLTPGANCLRDDWMPTSPPQLRVAISDASMND